MFDSVEDSPVAQRWHMKISLLVNSWMANFHIGDNRYSLGRDKVQIRIPLPKLCCTSRKSFYLDYSRLFPVFMLPEIIYSLEETLWIGCFKVSSRFSFLRSAVWGAHMALDLLSQGSSGGMGWKEKTHFPCASQNEKKHLSCINNLKIGQIHSLPGCFVLAGQRFQPALIRDSVCWDKLLAVMVPWLFGERGVCVTVLSAFRVCKNCLWLQL